MFKNGDLVMLNEAGKDCYERNKNDKSIPKNKIMKIISYRGFDNGRDIWEVEWGEKTDYYFEYCLNNVKMSKIVE